MRSARILGAVAVAGLATVAMILAGAAQGFDSRRDRVSDRGGVKQTTFRWQGRVAP